MKRKLIYNYWLIIVAWCLFLNNLALVAIIVSILTSLMLVFSRGKINYWRMCFVSVLSYGIISILLSLSNIIIFFPKLYVFIASICFNLSITNESLYLFKSKCLKPVLIVMIVGFTIISIVGFILPDGLYTVFTKINLYLMISFIFLPYLIPLVYCVVYKECKHIKLSHNYIKKFVIER